MTNRPAPASVIDDLTIRELCTLDEFAEAGRLIQRVWGSTPDRSPLNVQQLPAMVHAGCQVSAGFEGERMVAATMAFLGRHDDETILHSHVTGVDPDRQGAGLGLAMKLHQRQWCLDRGIGVVTWTFDPLVSMNARFNLGRLGARGVEYLRNFYGVMDDELNRDDPTDRLVARWDLESEPVVAAVVGGGASLSTADEELAAGAEHAVAVGPDGPEAAPTRADRRLVALPDDIVALRSARSPDAPAWRRAVRSALEAALADGHVVGPVTADGHLVTRHATVMPS